MAHRLLLTPRLLLRDFEEEDIPALFDLLRDEKTNIFLPWFPARELSDAASFYSDRILAQYRKGGYFDAICLRESGELIGYVGMDDELPHDIGYALKSVYWHRGFMKEAVAAFLLKLKEDGIAYVSATHDENNPRSGRVMEAIGMHYRYSYVERWMPKDKRVVFRFYDLSLDGKEREPWDGYRKMSEASFLEPALRKEPSSNR